MKSLDRYMLITIKVVSGLGLIFIVVVGLLIGISVLCDAPGLDTSCPALQF
jgi:hypothetical protein